MMDTPCAHLIERNPPECEMGRKIPEDCCCACAYYEAGLTDQERIRATIWADVVAYARAKQAE